MEFQSSTRLEFVFCFVLKAQHKLQQQCFHCFSRCCSEIVPKVVFWGVLLEENCMQCIVVPGIPALVHVTWQKQLLKVTKTVINMNRNEDKLNRPVYALRSVSSSAMTKPSRIPASQISVHRRDNSKTSVGFCMWNYFSTAAHIASAWGTGLQPRLMFWFFSEQSSVILPRESARSQRQETVLQPADMSRQHLARHYSVAAKMACSNTSSSWSEFQISLWKVSPTFNYFFFFFTKWLFVRLFFPFLHLPISVPCQTIFSVHEVWWEQKRGITQSLIFA